jgi:hypothetical protein
LRLFFWQRTGTKLSVAALVIAFGLILYMLLSRGVPPSIFEWVWLLLPPAFVIYIFLVQPDRIARRAAQNEQLVSEATWEVGDEGVRISNRFNSSLLEWQTLDRLIPTRDYYLLLSRVNKNAVRFIPRRAFPSAEIQNDFLHIMENHVLVKH